MKTLGAFEYIDIPILGLTGVKAKIDTGASISAIHSPFYDTIIKNGVSHVIYKMLSSDAVFSTNRFSVVNVTNSFGDTEIRYQVPITIKLNNEYFESQFTLTDRKELQDKVLIGKNIIQVGNFLVDIKKAIQEGEEGTIKCDNCGHIWEKSTEDTNPNLCQVCMFDGFTGAFTA
jgi:hypothetical protein